MKRFLLAAALLTFSTGAVWAQTDGIYADGDDQKSADTTNHTYRGRNNYTDQNDNNSGRTADNTTTQNGDVYNSYDDPDDYIDYDNSYSSRINRFNYPFSNMGYYSMFYNPFWYSPTWYDPYWGYNPWRPRVSVSFGWGWGGYSSWGWNTWMGYPAWGGWGGGYGGYGCGWGAYYPTAYYGGYWNRVANYNTDYRPYRNSNYGPRQSGQINQVGFGGVRGSGSGLKTQQPQQSNTRPYAFSRPTQVGGDNNNGVRNGGVTQQGEQRPRGLGRIFGGGNNNGANNGDQRPSRGIFGGGGNSGQRNNGGGQGPSRGIFGGGENGGGGSRSVFGGGSRNGGGAAPSRSIGGGGGGNRGGGGGGGTRSSGGRVGGRR